MCSLEEVRMRIGSQILFQIYCRMQQLKWKVEKADKTKISWADDGDTYEESVNVP